MTNQEPMAVALLSRICPSQFSAYNENDNKTTLSVPMFT